MRTSLRAIPGGAWVLSAALAASACGRPAVAVRAADPPTGDGTEVVAEADGIRITRAEMDEKAKPALARLSQQEYEARRQALDELIADKLVERAAERRGVSTEELLKLEVDGRAAAPIAAEVRKVFEDNKARFPGKSFEEMAPQIERLMRDRSLAERRSEYRQELRAAAQVRVSLDAPRLAVPIPADALSVGPQAAPVTIVEYLDYQCPYCHRAQLTVEQLLKQYSGRVRLVARDFPIEGHPRAFPAARAARCAGAQGKFWEYHKGIFDAPSDLGDQDLKARASALGLDASAFSACLASDRFDASIRSSVESGDRLGVDSTPTFFINGRMVIGARPIGEFLRVIDEELAGRG